MGAARRAGVLVVLAVGVVTVPVVACSSGRAAPATAPAPTAARAPSDSVSTGYGSQTRRSVTTAIGVLSEEELDRQRVARVEELLQGRVPGLQVMRTSTGEFTIRIRNAQSFMGNDEPLCVIDGVPIPSGGLGSALMGLNPQDIARIEVLKDAGATAIYGSQGGNGVLLITTKRH
jgi:TonB-dependent SusC/RagA subfamily outer membrane receptor